MISRCDWTFKYLFIFLKPKIKPIWVWNEFPLNIRLSLLFYCLPFDKKWKNSKLEKLILTCCHHFFHKFHQTKFNKEFENSTNLTNNIKYDCRVKVLHISSNKKKNKINVFSVGVLWVFNIWKFEGHYF